MAVTYTVTPVKTYVEGDRKRVVADIATTGTPTAGGDALAAAALGLDLELDSVSVCGIATNSGGTSAVVVAADHGTVGGTPASVNFVFYVQGTAGAANALVAYTGATANFRFRVEAVGKGKGLYV